MARSTGISIGLKAAVGDFLRGMTQAEQATHKLTGATKQLDAQQIRQRETALRVESTQARVNHLLKTGSTDTLQYRRAVIQADKALLAQAQAADKVHRSTGRLSGTMKTAAKTAAGAALAYASVSTVKDAVNTTEELGKTTLQLHKAFGLSVKSAGEWAATAKARDIDTSKLALSFKTLSAQVDGAQNGSKSAVKLFDRLGISQKELAALGGDTGKAIALVSDGLEKLPAGTEKTTLASKLLGRSWLALNPLLKDGSGNLKRQLELTNEYGANLGGKTVKEIEKMIQAQREQKLAMLGIQVSLGSALIPALTKGSQAFSEFVKQFRDGTGAGGKFRDKLTEIWAAIKPTIKSFADVARNVAKFAGEHPNVAKLAFQMAAVGLAIKSIKFASKISGLSTFLGAARTGASTFKSIWKGAGDLAGKVAAQRTAESFADTMPGSINARKIRMRAPLLAWGRALGPLLGAAIVAGVLSGISNGLRKKLDPRNLQDKFGLDLGDLWNMIRGRAPNGFNATGGKVKMPGLYVAGEEAPRHPEFVIATNPAYRSRNLEFFAQAGRALGVPGYKEGGVVGQMQSTAWNIARRGLPYTYGGGHGSLGVGNPGFDCSGYVSAILGAGGVISSPMAVREPLASNLRKANGPNDGPVVVGIRGSSGKNAHTMIRVGDSYYESGSGHGPRKVSGWSGSFEWFKPGGFGAARGGGSRRSGNKMTVGASVFSDRQGYQGDDLSATNDTWAELGKGGKIGNALGGLPYGTKIRVRAGNGNAITLVKRDVGLGGRAVNGHMRAVDLHVNAARRLGLPADWLGTLEIEILGRDSRAVKTQKRRMDAKKMRSMNAKRAGIRRSVNQGRIDRMSAGFEGQYQVALTTPGTTDDVAAANAGLGFANRQVSSLASLARMNPAKYGGALSEAIGNRDTWQGRVSDANAPSDIQQQQSDLAAELKRFNDFNERTLGVESHTLKKAVADVAAGQIGGMVFRAVQTPMWAGSGARY